MRKKQRLFSPGWPNNQPHVTAAGAVAAAAAEATRRPARAVGLPLKRNILFTAARETLLWRAATDTRVRRTVRNFGVTFFARRTERRERERNRVCLRRLRRRATRNANYDYAFFTAAAADDDDGTRYA